MTFVHPTACVEEDVTLGDGTAVWQNAHIRRGTSIGRDCIIGGNAYVAYGVIVGNRCKIQSFTYVCHGVSLSDGVFVGAGAVFTNDRTPRACTSDLQELQSSAPQESTVCLTVGEGATVGARSVVGPGVDIGRFAMIGMGAVVTRRVRDFELVVGNPGRVVGAVCRCGAVISRWHDTARPLAADVTCDCGLSYRIAESIVETSAAMARSPKGVRS